MKKYEIMCVFAPQDETFATGLTAVKKELSNLEATIDKEESLGIKKIVGTMGSHTHAHYLYFIVNLEPSKAHQIRKNVSLIPALIRVLVIGLDK